MSVKRCAICGKFIGENDDVVYDCDGAAYHRDCVENSDDYFVCEHCGRVEKVDDMHNVIGTDGNLEEWCDYCNEYDTLVCDRCGQTYSENCDCITWYDNLDRTYDDACLEDLIYDGDVARCATCGRVFYTDDMHWDDYREEWCCDDCYESCDDDDDDAIEFHKTPSL